MSVPDHDRSQFVAEMAAAPFPFPGKPYRESRVLFHLPPGFDPARPFALVAFCHGHKSTVEDQVIGRHRVPDQIDAADRNLVLMAPQFAVDAADSSPGKLEAEGGWQQLFDEAAGILARRLDHPAEAFAQAPVILAGFSGAHRAVGCCLARGGVDARIRGAILFDALFGSLDMVVTWMTRRRADGFLVALYTARTRDNTGSVKAGLMRVGVSVRPDYPTTLGPGSCHFVEVATDHWDLPSNGPPPFPLADLLRRAVP